LSAGDPANFCCRKKQKLSGRVDVRRGRICLQLSPEKLPQNCGGARWRLVFQDPMTSLNFRWLTIG